MLAALDDQSDARGPDRRGDLDEGTLTALGKLSEGLETVERARGHLYSFHQLCGTADFKLGAAADAFREAGHDGIAGELEADIVGRNVLEGRWSFQIIEDYDDTTARSCASASAPCGSSSPPGAPATVLVRPKQIVLRPAVEEDTTEEPLA